MTRWRPLTFLDVLAFRWLNRRHPMLGRAMWKWFEETTDEVLDRLRKAGFDG